MAEEEKEITSTTDEATNPSPASGGDSGVESNPPSLSRDEIRSRVFGAKPKSIFVDDFFGCRIELRQPDLQTALDQRDITADERVYFMLTDYCFVPGTNEKLFSFEDIDNLRTLPFGGEFQQVMDAVNKLLGINPEEVRAEIDAAKKSA